MRLDDVVKVFLSQWSAEGPRVPSEATVRMYKESLKWLVGFATSKNKLKASDLTPELLRAAVRVKMAGDGNQPSNWKGGEGGARLVVSAARKMASWLLAQNVPMHDLSVVRSPRAPERIQPRVHAAEFSRMEAAILRRLLSGDVDAATSVPRDMALINLLADTGLRAAEICGLRLEHLDLLQGWVQVRGKGSKERALSIRDPDERDGGSTMRLVRSWLTEREKLPGALEHDAVWLNRYGRPLKPNTLRAMLARICRDAGVDGNRPPHTFRRSHFSESYRESPETVRLLAARMGWSPKSHNMIDTYTRGANIELTRLQPVPLVSKRWRRAPSTRGEGTGGFSRARAPSG